MINQDFKSLHPIAISFWNSWRNNPDKVFLELGSDSFTYDEAFRKILRYYQYLKEHQKSQSRIIFENNDDFESYFRLIAIAFTGKPFIALQSNLPDERRKEILKQCGSDFVLETQHQEEFELQIDTIEDLLLNETEEAYIIFTSGSTGIPKGAIISKQNLWTFSNYYMNQSDFDWTGDNRFLQTFRLSFDFSMMSLTLALESKGSLTLIDYDSFVALEIPEVLQQKKITAVVMVPFALAYLKKYMKDFSFPDLKYSFFGGGPLYLDDALAWQDCLPNGQVRNGYGPTETTILCHDYKGFESKKGMVAMGYLFPDLDYKIVDSELLISGNQVFLGYTNPSDNRFSEIEGRTYYHTGDLVSIDKKGLFFFEGRRDFQVKIDGYRVELEEIEGKVKEKFGITSQACLIEKELKLIVEHIPEGLEDYLKEAFPKYMQIKELLIIDGFRLNSNGKLDRGGNVEFFGKIN